MLHFRDFQPDKVANVLPDSGMAAQALKDAASVLAWSGRRRPEEEVDKRGMSLRNPFCPFDKSLV